MTLLRLFGHPVQERDGVRAPLGVSQKSAVLLALLAAHASRPLSRDWLAQAVWPDEDAEDARANLRRHLHKLARAFDEDLFSLTRQTAQWNARSTVAIDVLRFEELSQTNPALAVDEYGGELCAGIADEVLDPLRLRYRSQYERLLRRLVADARGARDETALLLWLQRLIAYDPFDEESVRELMELRKRGGDVAGAVREFKALASRLNTELGAEPQPETTALFRAMTAGIAAPAHPNNLRAATTTFVGRETELASLSSAIREAGVVTIVGPGGAGKSRLALRFGFDSLPAFDDGVWHVELEHAKSESGIWERIAAACGVPDGRADSVLRALQAKRVLLLLDTCEHVLSDVRAVTQRLSRASGLRIVAASRRKLDVAGERVLELGPLETPPPHPTAGDSPMRYPAYRLFLERAAMARPAFRVDSRDVRALSELLRSIDGLPLAIELLAARANLLTIEGMRKRLSATLRSRRTIEDTVAWSYDLLSAGRQELFARLSAFHGTFTADDVEALAHGIAEPLESLFELADTSLIALSGGPQDARYRMLETTRFFARDRLRESASHVSTLLAHAEHVAKKTEKFSRIDDSALADVFGEAALLMPDVLAALESCTAFNWFECATRILDAVYRFGLRGHFSTDLLQLTLSLAAAAQGHEQVRAHFRQLAGGFAEAHGDVQLTLQLHEHAVEYYRNCRNEEELCAALTGMAVAEFKLAHYDRCELLLSEVLEHAQRAGDTMREAKTLARLGSVYSSRGEAARAMSTLQSAVRALRTLGDVRQLAMALRNLACLAFYEGQFAKLLPWIDEAIELTDKTADFPLYMTSLSMRASAQRELNRIAEAAASHSAICAQLSRLPHGGDLIDCLDDAAATLERAGEAALAARALGLARVLREQTGHMPEPKLQAYNDRLLERLQRSLNGSFQMELAAGARESVETLAASMMERFSAIR